MPPERRDAAEMQLRRCDLNLLLVAAETFAATPNRAVAAGVLEAIQTVHAEEWARNQQWAVRFKQAIGPQLYAEYAESGQIARNGTKRTKSAAERPKVPAGPAAPVLYVT